MNTGDDVVIPTPRGAAEPTGSRPPGLPGPYGARAVREEPGWVTLLEALDQAVAAMVVALEHQLCRADAATADRLRQQLRRARQLEATTANAVTSAHTGSAHTGPAPTDPGSGAGDPADLRPTLPFPRR